MYGHYNLIKGKSAVRYFSLANIKQLCSSKQKSNLVADITDMANDSQQMSTDRKVLSLTQCPVLTGN